MQPRRPFPGQPLVQDRNRSPPDPTEPSGPRRPLVPLAIVLGLGTTAGFELGSRGLFACGSVLLGACVLGWIRPRWSVRPRWAVWVCLLAFVRAAALAPREADWAHGDGKSALLDARARPLVGRWRTFDARSSGWLDAPGAPSAARLLLAPEGPPPEEGSWVAVLPGSEVLPWARGPFPSGSTRSERFDGLSPLRPDELVLLEAPPLAAWQPLADLVQRLRGSLARRVERVEGEWSRGLLRALLTSERDGLAPERSELFARTGTTHLLAISGLHVVFFAALVLLPLTRFAFRTLAGRRPSERSRALFLARILGLCVFVAVSGGGPPITRASLALVLALLARLLDGSSASEASDGRAVSRGWGRASDPLSLWAAAFSFECLANPAGLASLSLELSYAATLGLILGTGPLQAAWSREPAPWTAFRGPARTIASIVLGRAGRALRQSLAASLGAVLATLPISWSVFGELAPAGILLTPLALPPFVALLFCSWGGALLPHPIVTAASELSARALYLLLELGDLLPGTPVPLPPRPALLIWIGVALVFAALRGVRGARRAAAGLWAILLLPWSAGPSGLELHALDVGHGTAVVARTPGLDALIFDAGSRDRRGVWEEALAPLLARLEVARPWVVLSHADRDHDSALPRLLARYPAALQVGAPGAQSDVRPAHVRRPLRSPSLDLLAGRLEIRVPDLDLGLALIRGVCAGGNEGSRSLELTWKGERILLAGDAEERGLLAALQEGSLRGPARLALMPHHGSESPFLWAFLARLDPREVWISAAEVPPIAAELERRGLLWRWTGRDGSLALRLP